MSMPSAEDLARIEAAVLALPRASDEALRSVGLLMADARKRRAMERANGNNRNAAAQEARG